ncbi:MULTISPECIES: cysteine synthase A [Empedobacter]|uniref:Cysteine synthase n=1 Tax=Empedobacter falsenii TaxID=343874 RepID=A0A427BSV7_9FLAO|nr:MULTISPECIES: cysteine synthase A [Empedobacter]MBW1617777.1 cysteine synthase A [Empedobacter falsenii]MDH0660164.1 cysteine synthase A [Empedobacter sp. GD03865]MDH0673062.1 cysteine synthase A [Empedobacter sp. GD03861]MDH1603437.1 cysteine synthase A [Empedobacter sp. GD03739]MDH2207837.1 cysteine synthase A [Empedobacter sp. GD03644]
MIYNNVLETIGNTPIIKLNKLFPNHNVYIKVEKQNPGGSIKDRIALAMIEDAEKAGILKPGGTIIEPTSGNTGIGLSFVAAVKGYKMIITMPESMSIERRKIMEAYGAEFVLTPKELGMKGAIAKAQELAETIEGAWVPQQFENNSNPTVHYNTTAKEILEDFPQGVDYLITGVGTGGHLSGIGKALKEVNSSTKVIAVEPTDSPVISGGNPGPHAIQGIGAGFIPTNLDTSIVDSSTQITKEEAFEFAKKVAKVEGIFVGISTGASLAAVAKTLNEVDKNTKILTVNYDTGERYLSVEGLF